MDETTDIDDFFTKTGTYGWFQKRTYIFVCMLTLAGCCQVFLQVFTAGVNDHWCRVSQWENDTCDFTNASQSECLQIKRSSSIPSKDGDGTLESCKKFNVTGLDLESVYDVNMTQFDVIDCDEGWYFDNSVFRSTMTEDWNLVCDKHYIPNVLQSVYMAGYLGGSIVFGAIADWYGRYYILLFCSLSAGCLGCLSALSPNFYFYGVVRLLLGSCVYGAVLVGFVLGTELVAPQARVFFGVALWYACALAYFLLAGLARIIPSWRWLTVLCSTLYFTMIPGIWLISESPRWLLTKKKTEKANKILQKIALTNGSDVKEETYTRLQQDEADTTVVDAARVSEMVRSPTMMAYLICLLFNWFVQSFVYYGLSLGTSSLGVNVYVSFCLSGATEFLSYLVCIRVMEKFGRKWSTSAFLILAGLACFGTIPAPLGPIRVAVAMIGKFAISASFANVYVLTAEIFPTPLRTMCVGFCSIAARIGSIVAPLVLVLETVWLELPLILFSSSSLLAGLLVFILPETKGKRMPDTIQESIDLKKTLTAV